MKYLILAILAIATTSGLASSAFCQTAAAKPPVTKPSQQILISANNLNGATLLDMAGEEIGSVDRVTLSRDGRLVHLVTDVGGFLGINAREIAIPLAAVQLRPSKDQEDSAVWLTVDIAGERLKQAPVLEARDSLELTDAAWVKKNASYFGVSDTAPADLVVQDGKRPLLTTSDLIDVQVVGQGDTTTIAYLDDILFGFDDKPIKYAVLGYGGALGIGKDYVAIPFSEVSITEQGDDQLALAVPYNSKTLSEQQHVTPEGYPELKLSSVRDRIEE